MTAKPREMREVKLWPAVKAWLEAQGFTPHCEVFGHDVVAIRDCEVLVVELKMNATKRAFRQAWYGLMFANRAFIAVASKPRTTTPAQEQWKEIGVLRVREGRVIMCREALPSPRLWQPQHVHVVEAMRGWKPVDGQVAGLPRLKGCGPAQDVHRRLRAFFQTNPEATWREAYEKVPNHYAHHRSMQQHHPAARCEIPREAAPEQRAEETDDDAQQGAEPSVGLASKPGV
jgi:hypothetical protein